MGRTRKIWLTLRMKAAVRLWALWVPVLAREKHLKRLISRTLPRSSAKPYKGLTAHAIVKSCRKATRRPYFMADRPCLREGLMANRFLMLAGFNPSLHFGMDRTSLSAPTIAAHCWVVADDEVMNAPTPVMIEILRVANGAITRSGTDGLSLSTAAPLKG